MTEEELEKYYKALKVSFDIFYFEEEQKPLIKELIQIIFDAGVAHAKDNRAFTI